MSGDVIAPVVRIERRGNLALILIDNPPVNATSQAVRQGLASAIEAANADSAIEAIVIACEGRTFVAGADIREFGKPPLSPALPDVLTIVEASVKPVVAAVHGTALGGGFELALACHARVLDGQAIVGLPEVKLGLIPGAGGTQRLTRLVGRARALEIVLGCADVTGDEAAAIGYVNRVLADDEIEDFVRALATRIATLPPLAVGAAKRAVDAALPDPTPGLIVEGAAFREARLDPEAARRMRQFLEVGGQTREGERTVETLLDRLTPP